MSSLNKVQIIGNVVRDPEIRETKDGKSIVNLTVATSQRWKDKSTGEQKEKSEFHKVVIFSDGLANIVRKFVKKGSKIYIEGSLQTRKWTDNSGVEKYTTEIVLQGFGGNLVLLDGNKQKPKEDKEEWTGDTNIVDSIPF